MFFRVEGGKHFFPVFVPLGKGYGRDGCFLLDEVSITQGSAFISAPAIILVDLMIKNNRRRHAVHYRVIKIDVKIFCARRHENIHAVQRLAYQVVRLRQIFFYQRKFLVRPFLDYDGHYFAVESLTQLARFGVKN